MVARLTRQVAHALAVFEHEHAVAIEAANDRTRRSWSETPERDARQVLDRRAQRALQLFREFLAAEHRRGLVGVELASAIRAHRDHLTEMNIGIERQFLIERLVPYGQFHARRLEAVGAERQVIFAGRHLHAEPPGVVGSRLHVRRGRLEHDERPRHRQASQAARDRTSQRRGYLRTSA